MFGRRLLLAAGRPAATPAAADAEAPSTFVPGFMSMGRAYLVKGRYFCNDADQRLYRQSPRIAQATTEVRTA